MNQIIFFCQQMKQIARIYFFLCHQMNPMNRMAGAMYCLVHLVRLVIIKTTYFTKDNLYNQCNLLTKENFVLSVLSVGNNNFC